MSDPQPNDPPKTNVEANAAADRAAETSVPTSPAPDASKTLRTLGQRIRGRTTDFIAIAIIGFGLIAIGGHLADWWNTESDELSNPLLTAEEMVGLQSLWGGDGSPVSLDFGDSPYSLRKQFLRGKPEDAVNQLVQQCQEILARPDHALPPATAAETRLLGLVKDVRPIQSAEGWSIYRISYPTTIIVGVQSAAGADADQPDAQRVVCWGIMLPIGDQWSLFMIEPARRSANVAAMLPRELPPNARRTISLREQSGAFLMGITGNGDIRVWADFYQRQFDAEGWQLERDWNHDGSSSTARYSFDRAGVKHWVDIQFNSTETERCSGVIIVTPNRAE